MKRKRFLSKALAWTLVLAVQFNTLGVIMLPAEQLDAYADVTDYEPVDSFTDAADSEPPVAPDESELITFEPLHSDVAERTVPYATGLDELNLPETLEVQANMSAIPVAWLSEPEYDGYTPGIYMFTPVPDGSFTVLAEPPVIIVTVQPKPEPALLIAPTALSDVPDPYSTVTIEQSQTTTQIENAVQAGINYVNSFTEGGTVTVNGSKTGVASTLTLSIPSKVTVLWHAEYTGSTTDNMISVTGGGRFVVGDGANIEQTGTGIVIAAPNSGVNSTGITVSGGSVIKTGATSGYTIQSNSNTAAANILISGGTVSGSGSDVIYLTNIACNITVSGGKVEATGTNNAITAYCDTIITGGTVIANTGYAVRSVGSASSVVISGGLVTSARNGGTVDNSAVTVSGDAVVRNTNASNGTAIAVSTQEVTVTGGKVESEKGAAITKNGTGTVKVFGGELAGSTYGISLTGNGTAYIGGGTVTGGTARVNPAGTSAMFVERIRTSDSYELGSSTDLTVTGDSATAVWNIEGEAHGISYMRTTGNTGFITVPGVTVNTSGGLIVNGGVSRTVAQAEAAINMALANAAAGSTVTVTGGLSYANTTMALTIPSGKTLLWQAEYSGAASDDMLKLTGGGRFEVSDGAVIVQRGNGTAISAVGTGANSTGITISGGSVTKTGTSTGYTIQSSSGQAAANIIVSGGSVSGDGGAVIYTYNSIIGVLISGGSITATGTSNHAVYAYYGSVTITGGTLTSARQGGTIEGTTVTVSGNAIIENTATSNGRAIQSSTVTVNNGTIVTNTGTAIEATSQTVTINGGKIESKNGSAVAKSSAGMVNITGGELIGTTNGISLSGNAMAYITGGTVTGATRIYISGSTAMSIERTGNTNSYELGSSDELAITGDGATALWNIEGDVPGISYTRSTNTGFIAVPGAVVHAVSGITVNGVTYYTVNDTQAAVNEALANAASNGTVTVTGKLILANTSMKLTIPTGKTLLWLAEYSGASSDDMFSLTGGGCFEVDVGADIVQNGNGAIINAPNSGTNSTAITIIGGKLTKTGASGYTLQTNSTMATANITVRGGTVSGNGSAVIYVSNSTSALSVSGGAITATGKSTHAIYAYNGGVAITGGTISADQGCAVYSIYSSYDITITGGTLTSARTGGTVENATITVGGDALIQNTAESNGRAISSSTVTVNSGTIVSNAGTAIEATTQTITINGGTIESKTAAAILKTSTGTVTVFGGEVKGTTYGVSLTGNGTAYIGGGTVTGVTARVNVAGTNAMWIERSRTTDSYEVGTSTELTITPAAATAVWNIEGVNHGIRYTRNTNTGFIEVPGVSIYSATGIAIDGGAPLATVAGIQTAVNTALENAPAGATVTVTGSLILANTTLSLNIPSGKRLLWQAAYSGTTTGYMFSVTGGGSFEVADGADIVQNGSGVVIHASGSGTASSGITVSGGSVTKNGTTGYTIYSTSSLPTANIVISGGTVTGYGNGGGSRSTADSVIYVPNSSCNVTISGGTVTAMGSNGNAISGSTVIVNSGTVRAANTASAIYVDTQTATINGGTVESTNGPAILKNNTGSSGMVNINGGVIRGTTGVTLWDSTYTHASRVNMTAGSIEAASTGILVGAINGMAYISGGTITAPTRIGITGTNAMSVERTGFADSYLVGTGDDLDILPASANATAVWNIEGASHGIRYTRTANNTGLIIVPGVTVRPIGISVNGGASVDTVSEIQSAITSALSAAPDGGTVTVEGKLTFADARLSINIPAGKTVLWTAEYPGNAEPLISLTGTGSLKIAAGGIITQNGNYNAIDAAASGNAPVIILSGGSVEAPASYYPINSYGNVIVEQDTTIRTINANITVQSGATLITVPGTTFTVGGNRTLTLNGTMQNNGTVVINSTGWLVLMPGHQYNGVYPANGARIVRPAVITTASLAGGAYLAAYNETLTATGNGSYNWSVASGSLPGGLSLGASTGVISGIPNAAGTFNFEISAQNQAGVDTRALSIEISKITPAIDNLSYPDPASVLYSRNGVAVTTELAGDNLLTVYYEGTGGTSYARSAAPPANSGTYTVTVNIAEGANHYAREGIILGVYTIVVQNSGEITIGTNKWNVFWNTVTFGLFAKNTQTVKITAATGGGAVSVHYYLSVNELSEAALAALSDNDWLPYTAPFGLNPAAKHIVYARLTDSSGYSDYINSAGIVVYRDSVATANSLSYEKGSGQRTTVDLMLYGNTVNRITDETRTLGLNTDYSIDDGTGTITLNTVYLNSLAAGNHTLTVYYNPMGEEYPLTPLPGSNAPLPSTIALVITEPYYVTVSGGTGAGYYSNGAYVTVVAEAPVSGMQFKEWSFSPKITDASFKAGTGVKTPTAMFVMPAENITASAVYEVIPPGSHVITVTNDGNGISVADRVSAASGDTVTLTASPNLLYQFKQWQTVGGVITLSSTTAATASFTMPDTDVEVRAEFEYKPSLLIWVSGTVTCTLDTDGVFEITPTQSVTGAMANYQNAAAQPWAAVRGNIKKMVVNDGVTSIGDYAFAECYALTEVSLPETLKTINNFAFQNNTALASVNLPEGLTNIESYAFQNNTALTGVDIPDSMVIIGSCAFQMPQNVSSALSSVTFGANSALLSIGNYAFQYCDGLTGIELPNSLTSIGVNAFGSTGLETVTISPNFTLVGSSGIFSGITTLKTVVFEGGRNTIPAGVFNDSNAIETVQLPNSVMSIAADAFPKRLDTDGSGTNLPIIRASFDAYAISWARQAANNHRVEFIPYAGIMQANPPDVLHKYIPYEFTVVTGVPYNQDVIFSLSPSLPAGMFFETGTTTAATGRLPGTVYGSPHVYEGNIYFTVTAHPAAAGSDDRFDAVAHFTINLADTPDASSPVMNSAAIITHVGVRDADGNYVISGNKDDTGNVEYLISWDFYEETWAGLWIDGVEKTRHADYWAESGSTKVTIMAQTVKSLDNGEHTIAAAFYTSPMEANLDYAQWNATDRSRNELDVVAHKFNIAFGSNPGNSDPGNSDPGNSDPGNSDPGSTTPGGSTPGGAAPGGSTPGGATPGGAAPGGGDDPGSGNSVADNAVGANPVSGNPGGSNSDGSNSDGSNSDGSNSDGSNSDESNVDSTPGGDSDSGGGESRGNGDNAGGSSDGADNNTTDGGNFGAQGNESADGNGNPGGDFEPDAGNSPSGGSTFDGFTQGPNGENEFRMDGNGAPLIIRIDQPFEEFSDLYVDGELWARDVDYNAAAGSTILTIAAARLEQLSAGEHIIGAVFANETVEIVFTLSKLAVNAAMPVLPVAPATAPSDGVETLLPAGNAPDSKKTGALVVSAALILLASACIVLLRKRGTGGSADKGC